jgi:hypothetical protein
MCGNLTGGKYPQDEIPRLLYGVLYFVVSLFIPETKGKTLEELEHLFESKSQSCKSC